MLTGFIGITPADAGKTFTAANRTRLEQDHPRGCGENDGGMWIKPASPGSPPRMRGKPVIIDELQLSDGITPADAGKTC